MNHPKHIRFLQYRTDHPDSSIASISKLLLDSVSDRSEEFLKERNAVQKEYGDALKQQNPAHDSALKSLIELFGENSKQVKYFKNNVVKNSKAHLFYKRFAYVHKYIQRLSPSFLLFEQINTQLDVARSEEEIQNAIEFLQNKGLKRDVDFTEKNACDIGALTALEEVWSDNQQNMFNVFDADKNHEVVPSKYLDKEAFFYNRPNKDSTNLVRFQSKVRNTTYIVPVDLSFISFMFSSIPTFIATETY